MPCDIKSKAFSISSPLSARRTIPPNHLLARPHQCIYTELSMLADKGKARIIWSMFGYPTTKFIVFAEIPLDFNGEFVERPICAKKTSKIEALLPHDAAIVSSYGSHRHCGRAVVVSCLSMTPSYFPNFAT
jgi:hypothetical protein